jgi:uncharacterized protein YcbX
MAESEAFVSGQVVAIWRYPVKSMRGEEIEATEVTEGGLLGDRALALVDAETGKVASAKNPRRWPNLFEFQSAYLEPPRTGASLPQVQITLPDGSALITDQEDVEARLCAAVGRAVHLARSASERAVAEEYQPDHDWLPHPDEVLEFTLPPGTFFDCAPIHLVTTATLEQLRSIAPASRFEIPRFRPNFVIQPAPGSAGFVEDRWIGRTLELGDVVLRMDMPCARCVMTTLAQGDLPKDPTVLRTAVQGNRGNVGVYASVIRGGRVRKGDNVALS